MKKFAETICFLTALALCNCCSLLALQFMVIAGMDDCLKQYAHYKTPEKNVNLKK